MLKALLLRDVTLYYREKTTFLINMLFFLSFALLSVLSLKGESANFPIIGPSIIWSAAFFTILLHIHLIFQGDYQDGSLNVLMLGQSFFGKMAIIFTKAFAHWIGNILPLLCILPVIGLMFSLSKTVIFWTEISLFLTTPALIILGLFAAALSLGLIHNALITSMVIIPFAAPVIIFGTNLNFAFIAKTGYLSPLCFLLGLNGLYLLFCPILTIFTLKYFALE